VTDRGWIFYNISTDTYDTPDGTQVPAFLVDTANCLADVMYISILRRDQRNEPAAAIGAQGVKEG